MATPNADTSEIRRKGRQRLIGAVTIVLLLVVFVPMLLDPEPRQEKKDAVLAIPPKEGAAPLPAPSAPAKAPESVPAPVEAKPSLGDTTKSSTPPKAPEAPKAETARAAPPVTPAPVAAAKVPEPVKPAASPKLEGFAVQVGAFGDEEKLRQARDKLAAARVTHFIERLPSGLTRLRAGPYKTREEAEKATAGVKAAGLDGKVVPLP
jgi:DedD protein